MMIQISNETLCDLLNIKVGLFSPLKGFMNENEFYSVVDNMTLSDNKTVFTIPITLDIAEQIYDSVRIGDILLLTNNGEQCGAIRVENKFVLKDIDSVLLNIFKTTDEKHPGVQFEKSRSKYRIGGEVLSVNENLLDGWLLPKTTKAYFNQKGWQTIAGFQTRNPIHNAHERLQRNALELCDGLFINPIVGWKKSGDFAEEAVIKAYERMTSEFYPNDKVYLAGLRTPMRYAGPREALFHALIRKNLGCTHFIIGRDHAGVSGYYGAYDAHKLAREVSGKYNLGIELLLFREPYYCKKCGFVVSDKTCSHYGTDRLEVSGTIIRECLQSGKLPPKELMRPEIAEAVLSCSQIFID